MLSLSQAAEYLGMSASGLHKLIAAGKVVHLQSGPHGRIRFKPEWLDDYISEHTVTPREAATPRKRQRTPTIPETTGGVFDIWRFVRS